MEIIWSLPAAKDYDGDFAVQCALLHDTIEDTEATWQNIADVFGEAVANGVQALSKDPLIEGKDAQMEDSLKRIREQPEEVWSVKVADRISNLYQPPFYWNKERCQRYQDESRYIRITLDKANPILLQRLDQKIAEYQRFVE